MRMFCLVAGLLPVFAAQGKGQELRQWTDMTEMQSCTASTDTPRTKPTRSRTAGNTQGEELGAGRAAAEYS